MKLVVCALSLLAGLPSLMAAQISFALPRIPSPTVRAALVSVKAITLVRASSRGVMPTS